MGTAPAKGIESNAVSLIEEERPFQPPLLAHSRHEKTLLSSVWSGVTGQGQNLYVPGIIFGKNLPCKPRLQGRGYAGRVSYTPSLLYGFGIISGRFLTLLFMLFLSARFAVVHLGKIAFHGLQLPDTLFICPVLVVKGVLLGGKLLDFSLQRFIGG